jgi:hypothetical protein
MQIILNKLYLRLSSLGVKEGVFASEDIKKGETVEQCFIIYPENKNWEKLDKGLLPYSLGVPDLNENYDLQKIAKKHDAVSPLHVTKPVFVSGFGMLYNKSKNPNLDFVLTGDVVLNLRAAKKIKKDEELLVRGVY